MTKQIILEDNPDIELFRDSYKQYCEEEGIEPTEEGLYDFTYSQNEIYLEDIVDSFKKAYVKNDILVIADLGLWHGRCAGYRLLTNKLSDIFTVSEDYNTFYLDRHNLKADCSHHDGTNHYLFREVKDGVNIDNLLNKLYDGTATSKDITRYTRSLKPIVETLDW